VKAGKRLLRAVCFAWMNGDSILNFVRNLESHLPVVGMWGCLPVGEVGLVFGFLLAGY
jgi:hypothetical protein